MKVVNFLDKDGKVIKKGNLSISLRKKYGLPKGCTSIEMDKGFFSYFLYFLDFVMSVVSVLVFSLTFGYIGVLVPLIKLKSREQVEVLATQLTKTLTYSWFVLSGIVVLYLLVLLWGIIKVGRFNSEGKK